MGFAPSPHLKLMNIPPEMPESAPTPEMTEMEGGESEICVPLSTLSLQDESGEVPPDVGQAISGNIDGVVSRIEGDMVYITPTKFNGEDLPQKSATPQEETDEQYLDRVSQEEA